MPVGVCVRANPRSTPINVIALSRHFLHNTLFYSPLRCRPPATTLAAASLWLTPQCTTASSSTAAVHSSASQPTTALFSPPKHRRARNQVTNQVSELTHLLTVRRFFRRFQYAQPVAAARSGSRTEAGPLPVLRYTAPYPTHRPAAHL